MNIATFLKYFVQPTYYFSKDLILVYDDNNSIVYYNIKTQQIYDNNLFKKKNEYKNYHYVLGEWKKENSINLIEESD